MSGYSYDVDLRELAHLEASAAGVAEQIPSLRAARSMWLLQDTGHRRERCRITVGEKACDAFFTQCGC